MSIYDDDWGDTSFSASVTKPRRVSRSEQQQEGLVQRNSTFVAAMPPARRVEMPAQPTAIEIAHTGEAQQIINEATDPVRRALATAISSAFWGLIVVPLGLLFIWMTDADPFAIVLSIVGVVLAVGYMFLRFDRQAHEHSPAGVAIHDRELTHDERIHELDLRYSAYNRMIDHLLGQRDD